MMDRIVKPIFVILLWVCCAIVISVLSSAATFFVIGGNDMAHIHISGIIANIFFLLGFCLPYKFYRPIEIIPRKKMNANYSVGAVVCGFAVFVISHFWRLMFVKDIGTQIYPLPGCYIVYWLLAYWDRLQRNYSLDNGLLAI